MTTIQNILERATQLARETAIGSINPHRIGSIMVDTLQNLNEYQLTAGSLALQKIYDSISAMEADNAPVSDLSGRMLKLGQLVVISSNDDDSGKVYRYDGIVDNKSTWSFVNKIAQLPEHEKRLTKAEQDIRSLSSNKADKTGRYPEMSVGFADNLVGRGESTPAEFSFRASGGKSIKDGAARIKRLKGNSVVWNNVVDLVNLPANAAGVTATELDGRRIHLQGEFTNEGDRNLYVLDKQDIVEGHYYAVILQGSKYYGIYGYGGIATNSTDAAVVLATGTGSALTLLPRTSIDAGTYVDEVVTPQIIDLTLMFGAGNEPTTIEEYYTRKPIVEDEYAYNEGEVIHMTAEGIKSVGDNAWDEEWEEGLIANGENYDQPGCIRCKNYIPIIGGEQYHYANKAENYDDYMTMFFYDENKNLIDTLAWSIGTFPTPANARYMRFFINGSYGGVYKNDIILTLVHSGWKTDEFADYQPYWEDRLMFDERIKENFPNGMQKWDMVYNRNSKGYIVKGTGVVDLGTLAWEYEIINGYEMFRTKDNLLGATPTSGDGTNLICARYIDGNELIYTEGLDKSIELNQGYYGSVLVQDFLVVRDTSYTDAASFKAAMAGVLLYYQLAEPTIIEYDEPFNLDYRVADFGTEQMLTEQPSAPIAADIIYQFNAVDMIREHEQEIAELQSIIATMQAQLVSLTSQSEDIK